MNYDWLRQVGAESSSTSSEKKNILFKSVVQTPNRLCVYFCCVQNLKKNMSQQHAASGNDSGSNNNNSDPSNSNTHLNMNLDNSDDDEEDIQFVGIVRPPIQSIDLCVSPSTSAAAAAAAAGDSLKTSNMAAG